MMTSAKIMLENDCLQVSGDINFTTAVSLWQESLPLISRSPRLAFDFSRVTTLNSAALALLLEWIKYAKRAGKKISFTGLSPQLLSLADAAGVAKLFVL